MTTKPKLMPVDVLARRLREESDRIFPLLLPKARRVGSNKIVCSNIYGGFGNSLKADVAGQRKGYFKDFATQESGDVLDLLSMQTGLRGKDLFSLARTYLTTDSVVPYAPAKPIPRDINSDRAYEDWERYKDYQLDDPVSTYLVKRFIPPLDPTTNKQWFSVRVSDEGDMITAIGYPEKGKIVSTQITFTRKTSGKKRLFLKGCPIVDGKTYLRTEGYEKAVIVAEGVETALSLATAFPEYAAIATSSNGNMRGITIANKCGNVIIAYDNDAPGKESAGILKSSLAENGRDPASVFLVAPEDDNKGNDFNDDLVKYGVEDVRASVIRQVQEQKKAPCIGL